MTSLILAYKLNQSISNTRRVPGMLFDKNSHEQSADSDQTPRSLIRVCTVYQGPIYGMLYIKGLNKEKLKMTI